MDQLTNAAMIGTARLGNAAIQTDSPVDALTATMTGEMEQRLLLQAGAWAVYRLAGKQLQQGTPLPQQSEPETLPPCSPPAAHLIRVICADHQELLAEALDLLRAAGQRLPFDLLPLVLDHARRHKELRPAILHVVGERGRWLSRFNPAWSWVAAPLDVGDTLPPDAETIWNEGPIEQRCEMLRRMRLIDPAKGREWLQGVWKSERADQRYDLLAAFSATLEAGDIPFLEIAAQDRAEKVRDQAAELLAHIPESPLAERSRRRAMSVIQVKHDATTGKPLLEVTPPRSLSEKDEKEWLQDGLDPTPQGKAGRRSLWVGEIAASVEPTFWESHLSLPVADLITAAEATEYAVVLLDGWARAALRFKSTSWALPLWEWWWQVDISKLPQADNARGALIGKLPYLIPAADSESLAMRVLANSAIEATDWEYLLPAIPKPWGHDFALRCLEVIRAHIASLSEMLKKRSNRFYPIPASTLDAAALSLPPSCFAAAIEPMAIPEGVPENWMYNQLRKSVENFSQTIQLRQRLHEEIH